MRRLSTSLPNELYALICSRAELHRRSMNQEIIYLVETALAAEQEGNVEVLRILMMAQGGIPEAPSPRVQ